MSWVVLVLSGVLEAVWATALDRSDGFSRPVPSIVFVVALVLSMSGLGYAMRELPLGTSYSVWVGIGAVLTVTYAMISGAEPVSASHASSSLPGTDLVKTNEARGGVRPATARERGQVGLTSSSTRSWGKHSSPRTASASWNGSG